MLKRLIHIYDRRWGSAPPLSGVDKLCCLALVGILIVTTVAYELTDGAALRSAKAADEPDIGIPISAPGIDFTPLVEAVGACQKALDWQGVPLDQECQSALRDACETHSVPICLVLGLMEVESGFDPQADSGVSKGLMQLNERYFPADLSPEDNIQAGVAYLGELLNRYEDTAAALTAYNAGYDTGSRVYANAVLMAAEKWED